MVAKPKPSVQPDLAKRRIIGRPEEYTSDLGALICKRMIEVGSLAEACRADSRLPDRSTIYDWSMRHPEFAGIFAAAREQLMDRWADDLLEIADDMTIEPNDRRVRCDNRRWLMSKFFARRYGDKIQVAGDPENPLRVMHEAVAIERLSPLELDAIEQLARARLEATDVEWGQDGGKEGETPQKA